MNNLSIEHTFTIFNNKFDQKTQHLWVNDSLHNNPQMEHTDSLNTGVFQLFN